MPAFASPLDVAAAWRPLTEAETVVVATQLAFAAAIIRTNVPDVDDRLANAKLDRELVKGINVEMVLRRIRNPDGANQLSESVEDYQYTTSFDADVASGTIYLTDDELTLLRRRPRRSGAFSIRPANEPPTCATFDTIARHRHGCWP